MSTEQDSKKKNPSELSRTVSLDMSNLEIPDRMIENEVISENEWKYSIVDEIGRGGIGRVLVAFDSKLGRDIALKELIQTDKPGQNKIKPLDKLKADEIRFLREAKVTGQLEHPGIVPVYEIGRKPDGNHYYTMKLVRGMTLAKAIKDAVTLEKRLRLLPHFRDICNAIAYSHSRGVIHRDLKPENIMIGEFGETVVLDWGLAKIRGEEDESESTLQNELNVLKIENLGDTTRGKAIGTPAYMPPEQARGDVEQIDERSDIYSLGAVLYEILTGHPPFKGRNIKETLEMVQKNTPVDITILEKDAPPDLCAVVSKTLTRDKNDRYETALEVAWEIENFMSGGRIRAYEYSSWELFKRFTKKNKSLSALLLIFIILIFAGSAIILFAYQRSVENEKFAHLNLSLGYLEYAERLIKEKKYSNASIFSAASLYHNPYNPKSPWNYPKTFLDSRKTELSNQMLSIQSALYLSTVHQNDSFQKNLIKFDFEARDSAISPDGELIAVAGKNREVFIYSLRDGTIRKTLEGHTDNIVTMQFSPDGKFLVSGGWDKTLRLWNIAEGKTVKTFSCPKCEVYAAGFSPDGKKLTFGGTDNILWEINISGNDFSAKKVFESMNTVRAANWSPDGTMILVSNSSGDITLLRNNKPVKTFRYHREPVIAVKFLKDNRHFISTGYDKKILLWNIDNPRPKILLKHWDAFFDLDIASDGSMAVAASRDGTIKLIDLKSFHILNLRGHEGPVYSVSFLPMGNSIVSIGEDKLLKLWKTDINKSVLTYRGHTTYIPSMSYSPDGRLLASSSWDTSVKLWNVQNESIYSSFSDKETVAYSISFSPNGQFLATGNNKGDIFLFNPLKGTVISELKGHTDQVSSVVFSNDGKLLISGSKDSTIKIWDIENHRCLKTLKNHSTSVQDTALSPDGRTLASGGRNGELNFWSFPNGKHLKKMRNSDKTILSLTFSRDSGFILTAIEDGTIQKWDMEKGVITKTMRGHTGPINMIAASPEGSLFASVGKELILWDAKTCEMIQTIDLQYTGYSVVFENDGKHFAVSDGAVIKRYPVVLEMWKQDPLELLEKYQKKAGKKLEGFKLVSD